MLVNIHKHWIIILLVQNFHLLNNIFHKLIELALTTSILKKIIHAYIYMMAHTNLFHYSVDYGSLDCYSSDYYSSWINPELFLNVSSNFSLCLRYLLISFQCNPTSFLQQNRTLKPSPAFLLSLRQVYDVSHAQAK